MKYIEFRNLIRNSLINNPDGLTWKELKKTLNLPYENPCQTWIYKLEDEINLIRSKGINRSYIWKIDK